MGGAVRVGADEVVEDDEDVGRDIMVFCCVATRVAKLVLGTASRVNQVRTVELWNYG